MHRLPPDRLLPPRPPALALAELRQADLDAALQLTTLGWLPTPTPITPLPALAAELQLGWLGVKRDDRTHPTSGGSKVRKLNVLLAAPPYADAEAWISAGAIGSGHVVCCAEAARFLDRRFTAHLFWEPLCPSARTNLAVSASLSHKLRYHHSRLTLGLTAPHLLDASLAAKIAGVWPGPTRAAVIPFGATTVAGTLGLVRAGLELAAQVAAGALPAPEVVVVAFGTGGTAAGLALGLQLGGLRTRVLAVATVERALTPDWALRRLVRRTAAALSAAGLPVDAEAAQPTVVRGWVGRCYGDASAPSRAACARLAGYDVGLEPIYTGKAMAALCDHRAALRGKRVLFWATAHGPTPAPDPAWRARLPGRLRRRLERAERRAPSAAELANGPKNRARRRFLQVALVGGGLAAGGARLLGYAPLPTWRGRVLSAWEARVVMALGEALLPAAAHTPARLLAVARGVDAYLAGLPAKLQALSRAALFTVEQATPLGGALRRSSRLAPAERLAVVTTLHGRGAHGWGGPLAEAARGARDLVLVGWYQQPAAWPAVGYEGPTVPAAPRATKPRYARLRAAPGDAPTPAPRRLTPHTRRLHNADLPAARTP